MKVSPRLRKYIETKIFPVYVERIPAKSLDHIRYVIRRSLKFAEQVGADINMAYAIAAYHDIGMVECRKTHELVGGRMLREDLNLCQFFTPDQIEIMAQAVEDHRASSKSEPRSIYGRIVSSADRMTSVDDNLKLVHDYRKQYDADMTLAEKIADSRAHLFDKWGTNGYGITKIYFADTEFEAFLTDMRQLLADEDTFRMQYLRVNCT